jgi:predicted permease
VINDLRYAFRSFAKTPGFTLVAVLTLAVGIGASTVMYSALRALVVEPFSYPKQSQVVEVWPHEGWGFSPSDFLDLRDQASSFSSLGVYVPRPTNLGGEKVKAIRSVACTSGVLQSFGVAPAMGRSLGAEDEAKGAPAVVVISHELWERSFAGDPGIIGRIIRLDGADNRVVGVMPAGFEFASPWLRTSTTDVWTPLRFEPDTLTRDSHWLCCVGRLRDGVTLAAANAEIKAVGDRLAAKYPESDTGLDFFARPLRDEMTRYLGPQIRMLFGSVILVMLVACANVASMLLARGARRQGEFGIRIALGASRGQIIRLVLTESLLLALASAAAGLVLAEYGVRLVALISQTTDTRRAAIIIDGGALAFTVCATAVTALLAGLPPALAAFRLSAADASRADNRSVAGSRTRHALLRGLVVSQIAVAFALANIAALFSASYLKELSANKALATDYVLSAEVDLRGSRYEKTDTRVRFAELLAQRVAALPGVVSAGISSKLPLEGGNNMNILVNDETFDPKVQRTIAEVSSITPSYFAAQGLSLLKGRTLEPGDAGEDNIGVVVNKTLADKSWPGRDPIGQVIRSSSPKTMYHARVVGVVESVRQWGPKSDPNPEMYWTLERAWGPTFYLIVRSQQPAAGLTPALRGILTSKDSDLPLARVRTLNEIVRESTQGDRAVTGTVDFFMAAALGLVAVGLYGTLSYYVQQRTREIGIRMALGAESGGILGLILRQGLAWVGIGVAAGAVGSLALASVLRSLVWGVDTINPLALLGSAAVVALAALAACLLPAWRAARVDPIVALRSE